jgi:energy-coupling factor transport system permease protein
VARAGSTIGNGGSGGSGGADGSWAAVAWLVWALSAAASVQLAPSPVYVALVVAVAALVVSVHGLDTPFARAFPTLLGVGVVFALSRTVLTVATTHGGPGPTLFTTPDVSLPDALGGFTVGGPIELPILLQSAAEGFVIVGVLAVFGAFNAVVSHYELVQAMPRAFYEIGLVLIVALAFVPSTIAAISSVRDADRARTGGRVVRRGRLVRLVVPILETGMERAVALAESMDSRGFGRGAVTAADRVSGWCGFASLLALGGAFVALVGEARTAAVALGLAGAIGLAAAVLTASMGTRRVRYRPRRLTLGDWALVGASLAAPALLALLVVADDASLTWTASPLHWPTFHVLPALAIGLLLAPLARRPALMRSPRSLSGLGERIEEPV